MREPFWYEIQQENMFYFTYKETAALLNMVFSLAFWTRTC